jgi:hypothetical protein
MKDVAARPQSEMDVLKFYIWLMLVMTLAAAGLFWKVWSDLGSVNRNIAQGTAWTTTFAQEKRDIKGMLDVYKTNKENEARDAPLTWFTTIWRKCGIPDASIAIKTWIKPNYDSKLKCVEERIEIQFPNKAPLERRLIAQFCHAVEAASTRLRVIELEVHRADKEDLEKDAWYGKAIIGYRHPKTNAD